MSTFRVQVLIHSYRHGFGLSRHENNSGNHVQYLFLHTNKAYISTNYYDHVNQIMHVGLGDVLRFVCINRFAPYSMKGRVKIVSDVKKGGMLFQT